MVLTDGLLGGEGKHWKLAPINKQMINKISHEGLITEMFPVSRRYVHSIANAFLNLLIIA
jgi:hypothetical protein